MTALAKLAVACLKYVRTGEDLVRFLGRWLDVTREVLASPRGFEALERVMHYILLVRKPEEVRGLPAFLERELGSEAKEAFVTAGEKLIEPLPGVDPAKLVGQILRYPVGN